jgi:hypothetical protein
LFEQRERWLEELSAHVGREEAVAGSSGRMNLVAIAAEIVNADADERTQKRIHVPNWESMARDLQDTTEYLGPEAYSLARDAAVALIDAIDNLFIEQLDERGQARRSIDNERRPRVKASAAELFELLNDDNMMIAMWRDLIAACQNPNHADYSYDRVGFLRDNVVALQEHRRQDPGHWGLIKTAVEILFDYGASVQRAQMHVGDPPIGFDPRRQDQPTGLTLGQRLDLAEQWIVRRPVTNDVVVWFRINKAYITNTDCSAHANIAFYSAQSLAGGILDHNFARGHYSVVPEELLTDKVLTAQSRLDEITDYHGFEHKPGLVYARIALRDVESHRAVKEARHQLDCLLSLLSPPEHMWTILKGQLVFDDSWNPRPLEWGPKRDREPWTYFGNDHVARDLRNLQGTGLQVTPDVAHRLTAVRQLSEALKAVPRTDPEGIVMASVRAIEHCNTWTTRGRKQWTEFITSYLLDEFTRVSFLKRALDHTAVAIVSTRPNRSPEAPPVPELDAIREAVSEGIGGTNFNLEIAMRQIGPLKEIYAEHPLARPLAELSAVLQSGASIGQSMDEERERVKARVARLTRSRNAAIHGGPLSAAACDSIADFARDLADQALNAVTQAILQNAAIPEYMRTTRDENRQRNEELRRTGDQRHFMPDTDRADSRNRL